MDRYYEGGVISWVKSGELRESLITATEERVTETALMETGIKLVPAGAILLAMYGATVGRLAILGIEATTNQAVCHIVPDQNVADTRYLYHAISAQVPAIIAMGVGGAQPNISQGLIKDLKVSLPPLPEQRRIAAILDQADALRAKRREALALLDELQRGIFIEMFGDPASNPKNWPTTSLDEVASKITDGEHQTPRRVEAGIKLLSARNVQDGYLDFRNVDYIDEQEYSRIAKRCNPERDDILISCSGSIGRVAIVETDELLGLVRSAALVKLRKDKVKPKFLEAYLRTPFMNRLMVKSSRSSSQANLFQGPIRALPIFVPPLEVQRLYIERTIVVNEVRSTQTAAFQSLDALFSSLQHQAFRGEL